ncbi:unnamed protein product [Symbiodinium sp. CCMP2456]|nr:unnamed protein product [Symbiodinium sp. CCMP2456]
MAHKETLFAVVRSIKSGPRKASQAASNLLRLGLVETDRDHLALIRALGRQGAWAASLEVFESMQKAQLQPSDLHCTALMRACTKGGDPATAMRVFAEVAEPSAMVFAAAISTCGAAGDWEIALDILSAMEDAELNPDLVSFNAALAACQRAVKSKPALRLLEEIRRRELQPDVALQATQEPKQKTRILAPSTLDYSTPAQASVQNITPTASEGPCLKSTLNPFPDFSLRPPWESGAATDASRVHLGGVL